MSSDADALKSCCLIPAIVVIAVCVLTVGTWLWWTFGFPTARLFVAGFVQLEGRLERDGRCAYHTLIVPGARSDYMRQIGLDIEFHDGTVLSLADLDLSWVVERGQRSEYTQPEGTDEYFFGPLRAVVRDGEVKRAEFRMFYDDESDFRVRTARSGQWIDVPFSHDEALLLFGEPDRMQDEFRH